MPKLKPHHFSVRTHEGAGPYDYKSEVSVDSSGKFSIRLPLELDHIAHNLRKTDEWRFKVGLSYGPVNKVVTCDDKGNGIRFIEEVMRVSLQSSRSEDLVILYVTSHKLAYWKTAEGTIVPNGSFDNKGYQDGSGRWYGDNNANNRTETFSVGLAAHVYKKVTLHQTSGDKVTYETTYGDGDHWDRNTWLQKLNQFVGLNSLPKGAGEIPYTEEAAKFFYEAMIQLCTLSDRLSGFFGDNNQVLATIEARTGFMLEAPKGNIT